MQINCRAFEMNDEAKAKHGHSFKGVVKYGETVETFFSNNCGSALGMCFARVKELAKGRAITVAHYRSDKFRKTYTIWK